MTSENNQQAVALTASQAETVQSVLQQWSTAKLVDPNLASDLVATIRVVEQNHSFDWQEFSKYAYRLAALYFAAAVLTFVSDYLPPIILQRILAIPIALRLVVTLGIAAMVHTWGHRRSLAKPQERYLNEAIHTFGALISALAAIQLGSRQCRSGNVIRYRWGEVLPVLALTYGVVAIWVKSTFIWSYGIAVLGIHALVSRKYFSYVLGNYAKWFNLPIRFVVLGLAMICYSRRTTDFQRTTRLWGLAYFFNAVWALSAEDWYDSGESWLVGKPIQFYWILAFLFSASLSLWHGLRFNNSTTTRFGVAYLCINIVSTTLLIYFSSSGMPEECFGQSCNPPHPPHQAPLVW